MRANITFDRTAGSHALAAAGQRERYADQRSLEAGMKRWAPFFVGMALLLNACATTYQPVAFTGGYSHVQIDGNTFRVSFRGNAYTSRDRVETYLMYRCAELTAETGHDYFVIVGGSTDSRHGLITTPGTHTSTTTASAMAFGNTAYGSATTTGTYTPGQTFIIMKHTGTAIIKLFKGEKPSDNPSAFVAREVLQYFGPNMKK